MMPPGQQVQSWNFKRNKLKLNIPQSAVNGIVTKCKQLRVTDTKCLVDFQELSSMFHVFLCSPRSPCIYILACSVFVLKFASIKAEYKFMSCFLSPALGFYSCLPHVVLYNLVYIYRPLDPCCFVLIIQTELKCSSTIFYNNFCNLVSKSSDSPYYIFSIYYCFVRWIIFVRA